MTPNQKAFLDMLAFSEIGPELLAVSDNGYNVLVGSTSKHPLLFDDYSTHPNVFNRQCNSTAAGRYQLLHRYFVYYAPLVHVEDFSPASQDKIALRQISECRHALDDIEVGLFATAIGKVKGLWASLPGAGYHQHENKLIDLADAYVKAGGTIA